MAIFVDNFTGTNGTTLQAHTPDTGTSWTRLFGDDGVTDWLINASNQIAAESAINVGTIYTCDATYPSADYYIEWTAVGIGTSGPRRFYAFVRIQDQENMYAVRMAQPGTASASQLYKKVSGTWTALGTAFTTPADGSVCKLEINGTTLRFLDDGVELASVTVSDISAAGKAGIGAGGGAELVASGDDHHASNIIDSLTVDVLAVFKDGTATLSGTGALAAVGNSIVATAAALAGSGSEAAAASLQAAGSVTFSGTGSLQAVGTVVTTIVTGAAVLAGVGSISPVPSMLVRSFAALDGSGSLAAVGSFTREATAALAGSGQLAAVAPAINLRQLAYRWLNDDGNEAGATFAAALNTGIALPSGTAKRLRIQIGASDNPPAAAYRLEFRKVGDSTWIPLGANGAYQQLVLGLRPADKLYAYWPNNELSGSTAYDLSPNRLHATHNANVVLGASGPNANRKCGWYEYGVVTAGVPAFSDILGPNPLFDDKFPGDKGAFMVWCYAAAVVEFANYFTSALGTTTTFIDASLIGQLAGKTATDYSVTFIGGTLGNVNRHIASWNNTTGEVTLETAVPINVPNSQEFSMFSKYACHWMKNNANGGRPFIMGRDSGPRPTGILVQMEALNSKMTSNYLTYDVNNPPDYQAEQQAFTQVGLFDNAIDPGWQCFVVNWDKSAGAAGETYHYRNGVLMDIPGLQEMPLTGIKEWQYDFLKAHIGTTNQTGTFETSKHWHGGVCDLVIWRDTNLSQAEVTSLYNGGL